LKNTQRIAVGTANLKNVIIVGSRLRYLMNIPDEPHMIVAKIISKCGLTFITIANNQRIYIFSLNNNFMTNIFIFHGTEGYPEENWFPWIKEQLPDHNVIIPQFPTPENQTLDAWFEVFNKCKEHFTEDTILIGHSLGGSFLLRVLEQSKIKIKAAFTISAPIGVLPIRNYETDELFIKNPFNWEKIKSNCKNFFVFHSDNDPYVCLGNGKEIANRLGIELTMIPNSGHFNTPAGYSKFPQLLEKIKSIL
jgi:uncharacterized protein